MKLKQFPIFAGNRFLDEQSNNYGNRNSNDNGDICFSCLPVKETCYYDESDDAFNSKRHYYIPEISNDGHIIILPSNSNANSSQKLIESFRVVLSIAHTLTKKFQFLEGGLI